ncbi:MAG: hypothetical protein BWY70_01014 [Bacteroidetes bacterium ADurb.Bin408]|nr:MAG: hypothetical protein BWY70_01014 [Bacteroidetes bacterium ADurb.Bin408]
MKKIILFTTSLFLTTVIFAQTFQILNANKENVSNTGFNVSGNPNSIIEAHIYIVNTSASFAQFKVKKIETNVLANTVNTFCFNGQCYPPSVFETPSFITLQAGDTSTSTAFYGDYTPNGVIGASVITYVVFNANNTNDSTYVNVTYTVNPASVYKPDYSKIEFSNPYPNPAVVQARINYNIPYAFNSANLILRNLIGTKVKEIEITNPQGKLTIDVTDLNEGIYFYSLIIDGNIILTRKLIKD